MKPFSWRDLIIGLVLGAALSFVFGCVYAYAMWNPPSNDWGNEKTTTTILLTPVLLVVLGLLWWLRKPLRRGLGYLAQGVVLFARGVVLIRLSYWSVRKIRATLFLETLRYAGRHDVDQ